MLPGIDGLTLLRELHARAPELPVVILSARSELSTKLRSFELGAVDYLPKPFSLDELLARVRVQLRGPRGEVLALGLELLAIIQLVFGGIGEGCGHAVAHIRAAAKPGAEHEQRHRDDGAPRRPERQNSSDHATLINR